MLIRIATICLLSLAISLAGCSRGNKTPSGDGGQSGGNSLGDITKSAERGDAQAQLKLGLMYRYGNGTSRNAEEAVKWLRKAAEQGNINAMSQLYRAGLYPNAPDYTFSPDGRQIISGTNTDTQNPLPLAQSEALSWLRKAADQGDKNSMFFLGAVYQNGHGGVVPDAGQAKAWYDKAASQGHAEAEMSLALMLLRTDSPVSDPAQGMKWLKKAAEKGHPDAQETLRELGAGGSSGPGRKTMEQTYADLAVAAKKEAEKKNQVVFLSPPLPIGDNTTLSPDGTTYHSIMLNPFSLSKSFWMQRLKAEEFTQVKNVRISNAVYPTLHRWIIHCSDGDLVFLGDYYNDKDGERYVTKFLQYKTKK